MKKVNIWIVALLIILVGGISYGFGSGVIELNFNKDDAQTKNIEEAAQETEAEEVVDNMENEDDQSEEVDDELEEEDSNPEENLVEVIELSLGNVDRYFDITNLGECQNAPLNHEAPNTTVTLSLPGNGVKLEIPYNESWGNDEYTVAPYEFSGDRIMFGELICQGLEGPARWTRANNLDIKPQMEAEDVIVRLNEEAAANGSSISSAEIIQYGDNTAVKYTEGELCSWGAIEIIGKTNNFAVSYLCNESDAEWRKLETVAKNIKFL